MHTRRSTPDSPQAGQFFLIICCLLGLLILTACSQESAGSPATAQPHLRQIDNGTITYDSSAEAVVLRIFRGGGHLGTLDLSPLISIYGDGTFILGPGLQMREGHLSQDQLNQLLHTLVNSYGLPGFKRQQFYDIPDQDATLLQFNVNNQRYQFLYSDFGNREESQQDMDEYQRLGEALTAITSAIGGHTSPYSSDEQVLLARQDFSPDLTQKIPVWSLPDFTLNQVAIFECGPVPQDITGPNADSGCLTFTIPRKALLLSGSQRTTISELLHGHESGEFYEPSTGFYYTVMLRPLLPDERLQGTLAMYGSQNLTYTGVPLYQGPVPTPVPTAAQ
jgi:hypothetical protein